MARVDAGTIYSEVRIEIDKLKSDIKQAETRLDQFANKNKQQSEQVKRSWKDSFKNVSIAGVLAFAAIGLAVKAAIGIFAKYEQSMANVRSVTDATAEDFKLLEEAAIDAGESTRFTATQAADALYFLASAGLDAKQSISALQGVLQLAGATGSDLASTSATMAATLSQFSLKSEESTRVSNVFSAAIAGSQANMEKLGNALKQVGPISGALDISLEETVASLEALFNAGFAGQQAGTGLRNILLDLSDSTGPVIKQLEALGVAFDTVNPREIGLTNAIDELARSGVDLGSIFGKRVAAQILILAKTGGDALRELEAEITNTNSAAEMYAIQNDTLAGSVDFLKSAMESMAIGMVEDLSPAIRGIVDFLAEAVRNFNALPGPIKSVITILATAGPVIAGVGAAVAFLSGAFTGLVGAITILGSIFAVTGILHNMVSMERETSMINMSLERAVNNGADLNEEMVKMAKATGKSLDEIRDIAMANENINGVLIEQERINKEILSTYTLRATTLGYELEINKELLTSNTLLGFTYRRALDLVLEELESRQELAKLNEEERQRTAEENQRYQDRLDEIIKLEEEFRRANLTEQEKAFDDLEIKHRQYLEAKIDDEEWYRKEVARIIEEFADKSTTGELPEDEQADATERLNKVKESYRRKLEEIGATELELLELQRANAEASIRESEATDTAKQEAINAVNEYYDLLIDNTANARFKDNFRSMIDTILSGMGGLFGAIAQLSAALTNQLIADLDAWLQAELEAAGLVEDTTIERLQKELDAAIAIGDLETAEELRQDLERATIEEEYQKKLAQIKYEGELKQWTYTLAIGIASAASAILSGYASKPFLPVGLLAGILATAKSGIQIAAIKAQKPTPPGAQTGMIVLPQTGGTNLNVAENDAAELLLNGGAEGEAFLNQFAQRIADIINTSGGKMLEIKSPINMDGKKVAEIIAKYYNGGIVRVDL